MTEAPERIWATINGSRVSTYSPPFLIGGWESRSRKIEREVEYVRADLYAKLEADLAAANARADALREAAELDADLLFDAYKAVLVLHRILDKQGLEMGVKAANEIADRIVKAHPEFPGLTALRALAEVAEVKP